MADNEIITAEKARREMHDNTASFFKAVRFLTEGIVSIRKMSQGETKRTSTLDVRALFEQEATPGTYWNLSLPKALVESARVQTLIDGNPSTAADYVPGSELRITTIRAYISTVIPSSLYFLGAPDEIGRRDCLRVGADEPADLAAASQRIFPQTMLIPGHFEEA